MSKTNTAQPPTNSMKHSMPEKTPETNSVIRVLDGVIHWITPKLTWSPNPMEAKIWEADRASAYACAQSLRGLLTKGCGLHDIEQP